MANHYQRDESKELAAHGTDESPPDAHQVILHHVLRWMQARKASGMPEPAPARPSDAITWWLSAMQEPEQIGETRKAAVSGQMSGERWETGYANRCAFTLLRWLDMPKEQRFAIVAGVREDRVCYRGDAWEFYREVLDETYRMREIGVGEYRAKAAGRADRHIGAMMRPQP